MTVRNVHLLLNVTYSKMCDIVWHLELASEANTMLFTHRVKTTDHLLYLIRSLFLAITWIEAE